MHEVEHAHAPRHNLPPRDYERFVGRQSELAEVRRLLGPRSRAFVITIDGIGGIGKSALAQEAAYSLCEGYGNLPEAERFEAIVWVSAKRSYLTADGILERRQAFRTLSDVYAALAQVLDFPAITRARAEEQRVIVEQVLSEQRTLLILDNLETVDDEDLMVFLRELPNPTKALVTTRHRIDVAHPVRLTGMPHQDALALIEQEAARKEVEVTADDREQLWQRTGGVPLAIVWSIGIVGLGGSVESVLRRLGSGQNDITQFCFAESVAEIRGRDAYWLLLALSLFASDASREALGVVAGLGEDTFGRDVGLEDLLRLSLVNKSGDRFSLLPLTRSFVGRELDRHGSWAMEARARLVEAIYQLVSTDREEKHSWEATDRLELELPNIRAVRDELTIHLHYNYDDEGALYIAPESVARARRFVMLNRSLVWVTRIRGYWADCEMFCQIGVAVSRGLADYKSIGFRCADLGRICLYRGEYTQSHHWTSEAKVAFLKGGFIKEATYADRQLGMIALFQNNLDLGERLIVSAAEAYQQLGSGGSWPGYCGSLGSLAEAKGELETAEHWFSQAAELFAAQENLHNQAADLHNLGRIRFLRGDIQGARRYLDLSLAMAKQCGRAEVIARSCLLQARISAQQDRGDALSRGREALQMFRRLGMKREQAEAEALLRQLGEQP